MARSHSTSITRRSAVAGLALTAAPVALARVDRAHAQAKQTMPDKSLYERLGGVFAIAAVVDHFSDAVVKNPIVGQKSNNPQLREWHTKNLGRLPERLQTSSTLLPFDATFIPSFWMDATESCAGSSAGRWHGKPRTLLQTFAQAWALRTPRRISGRRARTARRRR
jgi:hypothetical protein